MMDTPEDNTAVLRMKQDFEAFMSHSTAGQTTRGSSKLTFDPEASYIDISNRKSRDQISMQVVFDKQKEARLREAELIKAKASITKLESKVSTLETSRKRARIETEREIENLRTSHKRELDGFQELQNRVQFLANKEEQRREELVECRKTLEVTKTSYEQRLLTLQKEKHQLEGELQEQEETSRSRITELKNQARRQETELQIQTSELEELQTQLQNAHRRAAEANKHLQELENCKLQLLQAQQQVKELEQKLEQVDDDAKITKAMKSQLSRMPELERENCRLLEQVQALRDQHENTLLLKEEGDSLKQKLARAEQRTAEYTQLQIENEELLKRLQKWEATLLNVGRKAQSPADLSRHMGDLQNSQVVLLEKQGQLQASAHAYEKSFKDCSKKLTDVQNQLGQEHHKNRQLADLVKRLQRKLLLVTKERDGFKGILDSYENEVTANISDVMGARIRQLEDTLNSYHKHIASLEAELNNVQGELLHQRSHSQLLEAKVSGGSVKQPNVVPPTSQTDLKLIAELRGQIATLQQELEKVTEERDIFEARIEQRHMQGDYDPTKTKIIHFSMNPADIAQEERANEVSRLKEENERLQKRIQVLEESGGSIDDLTERVDQKLQEAPSGKAFEEMKSQITAAELKNKRLMEAFKKTSHDFRDVCYQLTGYRIDIPCSNQYKLMNMYAESPGDYLMFQQSPSGELQLLENEYSSTLEDKIETYLQQANSIPAFLSSITTELFSRQTIMMKHE